MAKEKPTKQKPLRCSECGQFGHDATKHTNWLDVAIMCGDLGL